MEILRIAGSTRNLGAPADWNDDRSGPCVHLPIRDEVIEGVRFMTSAFAPTPAELEALNAGAPLILSIQGINHPVIRLGVGVPQSLET